MNSRVLTIVSGLFFVSGALALVGWVSDVLFKPQATFDVQILNLWIARWLMDRDPRGYSSALVALLVSMVLSSIFLIRVLVAATETDPTLNFVNDVAITSWAVVTILVVAWTAVNAWQYQVLCRPEIRALFKSATEPVAPA